MCVVSMVHDWAQTIPQETWTLKRLDQYQELIRRLEEIDRKLDLPDCSTPEKSSFLTEIAERLSRVERKLEQVGKGLLDTADPA